MAHHRAPDHPGVVNIGPVVGVAVAVCLLLTGSRLGLDFQAAAASRPFPAASFKAIADQRSYDFALLRRTSSRRVDIDQCCLEMSYGVLLSGEYVDPFVRSKALMGYEYSVVCSQDPVPQAWTPADMRGRSTGAVARESLRRRVARVASVCWWWVMSVRRWLGLGGERLTSTTYRGT